MTAISKIAAENDAEAVAILRRAKRCAEILAMDASDYRMAAIRHRAEEMQILMDVLLRRFGEV